MTPTMMERENNKTPTIRGCWKREAAKRRNSSSPTPLFGYWCAARGHIDARTSSAPEGFKFQRLHAWYTTNTQLGPLATKSPGDAGRFHFPAAMGTLRGAFHSPPHFLVLLARIRCWATGAGRRTLRITFQGRDSGSACRRNWGQSRSLQICFEAIARAFAPVRSPRVLVRAVRSLWSCGRFTFASLTTDHGCARRIGSWCARCVARRPSSPRSARKSCPSTCSHRALCSKRLCTEDARHAQDRLGSDRRPPRSSSKSSVLHPQTCVQTHPKTEHRISPCAPATSPPKPPSPHRASLEVPPFPSPPFRGNTSSPDSSLPSLRCPPPPVLASVRWNHEISKPKNKNA